MRRLLIATTLVIVLPALSAAKPITEELGLAAAEVVLIDVGALSAPIADFGPYATVFAVETLVISDAAETLSLDSGNISFPEALPDMLFPTAIPTMPEVVAVPPVASTGDGLPLPGGETGGGSVGGGSSGGGSASGGSSSGSGSSGSGSSGRGAPGNSTGGGSSSRSGSGSGGSSSGGGSGSGGGSAGSGGGLIVSIPTPSALFLVGSGLLGIVVVRRFWPR